jgi:hypothetical protein
MKEVAGKGTSVRWRMECFEEINQHVSGTSGHRNIDKQGKKYDEVT